MRARKKKTGFIVKLVILCILALGLFVFTRLGSVTHRSLKGLVTNEGVVTASGYRNIALFGLDSRDGQLEGETHSDTIIVCSINQKTKDVKLVSVYRDTYLDNTNGEYRKATECYFYGGPERAVNMLNKNLDLDISDYVAVDFNAVVKLVDLVGGIDLEVTDEELQWLNGYMYDMVQNGQVEEADYQPLEYSGYQHLNGIQTLAYCRIRYTAGYDFRRTERQRTVLTKVLEAAKGQGVTTLVSVVNSLLPYVSTSMGATELISLAGSMGSYVLTDTAGFPFDLTTANISAGDCVIPVDLARNVSQLHAFLFGEEGYTPSQTVQEISNTISYNTGIYG